MIAWISCIESMPPLGAEVTIYTAPGTMRATYHLIGEVSYWIWAPPYGRMRCERYHQWKYENENIGGKSPLKATRVKRQLHELD